MNKARMHYHKCCNCLHDVICITTDCAVRATVFEADYCCPVCQEAAQQLLAELKANAQ